MWNYAKLSSAAKLAGGPDAFVQGLINTGKQSMVPTVIGVGSICVGGGILLGIGLTAAYKKVEGFIKDNAVKKLSTQQDLQDLNAPQSAVDIEEKS